jgi:hypothetical protein
MGTPKPEYACQYAAADSIEDLPFTGYRGGSIISCHKKSPQNDPSGQQLKDGKEMIFCQTAVITMNAKK